MVRQFPVLRCARFLSRDSCYVEIHVDPCKSVMSTLQRRNMFIRPLIKQKKTLAYETQIHLLVSLIFVIIHRKTSKAIQTAADLFISRIRNYKGGL